MSGTPQAPGSTGAPLFSVVAGTLYVSTDGGVTWATIQADAIPDASLALTKLAAQANNTVVGNIAGTASPVALTATQLTALINPATGSLSGALPHTGVPVGLLPGSLFKSFCSVGADASGGATHITATGVKIGDSVVMVANVTDHASAAAVFEATVTVNDQIQQSSTNLSAKTLVILVIAQS